MKSRSPQKRRSFKRRLQRSGELLGKSLAATGHAIMSPFSTMGQATRYVGRSFEKLRHSANFRELLAGLPAIAVTIVSFVFFAYHYFRSDDVRSRLAGRYQIAAEAAFENGQQQTAVAYFDRLISLRGEDNEALFGLAKALDSIHDTMRLATVKEKISPIERAVYGPAHIWSAKKYLEAPLTAEKARAAEIHLRHAYNLDASEAETNALLGKLYFLAGRYESAVYHFQLSVDKYPSELLELAKAHVALQQIPEATQVGRRALEYFGQALVREPLNVKTRLKLAESWLFFEEFDKSLSVLQQGLAIQESTDLKKGIALVHLTWSNQLKRQGKPEERLPHIQAAIAADPNEMQAFQQVMEILNFRNGDSEALRADLVKMLAEGRATALIHLLLGTDAGDRGDTAAAAKHLELACREDPKMTFAANNLAWVLAHEDPPDYERALALIDAVLAQDSQFVAYHHTRGIILVGLQRWQEAIVELERSLPTKGDPETRVALATAYEHLGLNDLAVEQRRLAAADTNSQPENP